MDESPANPFPIGLFADDLDSVDDMMKTVVEMRRRSRLRDKGDEHAGEGSPTQSGVDFNLCRS